MTSKGTGIHWYISPRRLVRNEHKVTKRAIGGSKQAKLTMSLDVITQSMTSTYVGTSSKIEISIRIINGGIVLLPSLTLLANRSRDVKVKCILHIRPNILYVLD